MGQDVMLDGLEVLVGVLLLVLIPRGLWDLRMLVRESELGAVDRSTPYATPAPPAES